MHMTCTCLACACHLRFQELRSKDSPVPTQNKMLNKKLCKNQNQYNWSLSVCIYKKIFTKYLLPFVEILAHLHSVPDLIKNKIHLHTLAHSLQSIKPIKTKFCWLHLKKPPL